MVSAKSRVVCSWSFSGILLTLTIESQAAPSISSGTPDEMTLKYRQNEGMTAQMDDTDRELLAQLESNARLPVATLARRLGLARSTVQARIERLEEKGIIAGYALRLGDAARGDRIRATVLISIEPRSTPAVLARLKTLTQVEAAHTASGRWDMVLQLAAPSTASLDEVLDAIGEIDGVNSSESLIHLSTRIDRLG